jgi:hypothetical protein
MKGAARVRDNDAAELETPANACLFHRDDHGILDHGSIHPYATMGGVA